MEEQGFTIDRLRTGQGGAGGLRSQRHIWREAPQHDAKKSQIKARTRGDRSTPNTLRVSIIFATAKDAVPHSLPNQLSRPLSQANPFIITHLASIVQSGLGGVLGGVLPGKCGGRSRIDGSIAKKKLFPVRHGTSVIEAGTCDFISVTARVLSTARSRIRCSWDVVERRSSVLYTNAVPPSPAKISSAPPLDAAPQTVYQKIN